MCHSQLTDSYLMTAEKLLMSLYNPGGNLDPLKYWVYVNLYCGECKDNFLDKFTFKRNEFVFASVMCRICPLSES